MFQAVSGEMQVKRGCQCLDFLTLSNHQVEKNGIGRTCSKHGSEEKYAHNFDVAISRMEITRKI
jgi:hypothetical protein